MANRQNQILISGIVEVQLRGIHKQQQICDIVASAGRSLLLFSVLVLCQPIDFNLRARVGCLVFFITFTFH
jgi:hypothetical protein